jgi:DNA-directed RNA polymerase specialized sigma24 family protein
VTSAQEFKQFYLANFGRLVGQLALIAGDRHEAEEVVQEAFTRAAGRSRSIPPASRAGPSSARTGSRPSSRPE